MAMRWLTREWQSGSLPEAERRARWFAYLNHRDATAIHLPPGLHRLAAATSDQAITLHAAVPDWWVIEDDTFTMEAVCGNPDAGYQRVLLQYRGDLELLEADRAAVDGWLSATGAELLYDELEVLAQRRFEHRFLLGPDGQFGIRFSDVTVVSATAEASVRDALLARRASAGSVLVDDELPAIADMPIGEPTTAAPTPSGAVTVAAQRRSLREAIVGWFGGLRRTAGGVRE